MAFVFAFDHDHGRSPTELEALLGGKGANLAEMTTVLGLPVPPGFTITTEACRAYLGRGWPTGLDDEIDGHVARLEARMGRRLGDARDPLLVSVRSGAEVSMPGMMDTVLNLGLNRESVQGLAAQTDDERFAQDSYRRFIQMYGKIVLGLTDEQIVEQADKAVPQDPRVQLRESIRAVFASWRSPRAVTYRRRERIPDDLGTAVNVQAMVFGNRDDRSGTGVGFTRNPATGDAGAYGDFLIDAQGEDVVAGVRNTLPLAEMQSSFPAIHRELLDIFARLEAHYRDMIDTEFTIEQDKLWMLQARIGKRTGAAALRIAVALTEDPNVALRTDEAVMRVLPEHLDQVLHPQLESADHEVLAVGLPASPGAAVGKAYFDADRCIAGHERGERVVLVRPETSPDDVHGLAVAEGVLTSRGGLVSHAAVVARGWGKPAVCGAESLLIEANALTSEDGTVVREGDVISLDGTTGRVFVGAVAMAEGRVPPEFDVVLGWADAVRAGRLDVRANADNGADAARARAFGAAGIGLCRTEHMFLGDRLPVVRRMILADTPAAEADALAELLAVQREDFEAILAAMDGMPVTVRLLDPPLHEFLPPVEELAIAAALGELDEEGTAMLAAARRWQEQNPMLGVRGVRLGIIKEGLYKMQVRALLEAAVSRREGGGRPIVEIMIPLVVTRSELELTRRWVEEEIASVTRERGVDFAVAIGTMIETPRAAIRGDDIATSADFFSFGTNDLTQMTFGFSRDDVAPIIERYLDAGLLPVDPFESLDVRGVGELVRLGVERGRATRPDLKVGVCGEHGGDPESIRFFHSLGFDYVSCSPYRVPIARLAAARAVVAAAGSGDREA